MNAAEIAETLLNGNIAQARAEIIYQKGDYSGAYNASVRALDVVDHLADLLPLSDDNDVDWAGALAKVRRCLEGAP